MMGTFKKKREAKFAKKKSDFQKKNQQAHELSFTELGGTSEKKVAEAGNSALNRLTGLWR